MYREAQELLQENMDITIPKKSNQELMVIPHEEAERLQEEARIKYKEAFNLLKDL